MSDINDLPEFKVHMNPTGKYAQHEINPEFTVEYTLRLYERASKNQQQKEEQFWSSIHFISLGIFSGFIGSFAVVTIMRFFNNGLSLIAFVSLLILVSIMILFKTSWKFTSRRMRDVHKWNEVHPTPKKTAASIILDVEPLDYLGREFRIVPPERVSKLMEACENAKRELRTRSLPNTTENSSVFTKNELDELEQKELMKLSETNNDKGEIK